MKRFSRLLLGSALIFMLFSFSVSVSVSVYAADGTGTAGGTCGTNLTWTFSDGVLTVTGSGEMSSFTSGNQPWENVKNAIVSVTVNDGVSTIGDYAFYGCTEIRNMSLPDSLTGIGNSAFYNCSGLTGSFEIPEGVTNIGDHAFCGCSGLSAVTVPESVTLIGSSVFLHCDKLEELTLPFIGQSRTAANVWDNDGIKYYASINHLFSGSEGCGYDTQSVPGSLKKIKLTDTDTIPEHAFTDCGQLSCIEMPDTVTDIGDRAFSGTGLTGTLVIPKSVTTIGMDAFSACSGLTGLSLPEGLVSICSGAFCGCKGLTGELILPGTLVWIEDNAFEECTGLSGNLKIPENVMSIGNFAFYLCSGLTGELIIPEGVEDIGTYAFCGCSGLTGSLTIPGSVKSIGASSFCGCSGLTGTLSMQEGVESIKNNAFQGCSGLTAFNIPSSVYNIEWNVFDVGHSITVCYGGTREEWEEVKSSLDSSNSGWYDNVIFADNELTVTFDVNSNGGTGKNYTKTYDFCANADLSEPEADWGEGYSFVGRSLRPDSSEILDVYPVSDNVTLYAVRQRTCKVDLIVDSSPGQTEMTVPVYNSDACGLLKLPAVNGGPGTCAGWREDTEPAEPQYAPEATVEISGSKKLYAVYTRKLTVSYDANGGTDAPAEQSFTQYVSVSGKTSSIETTLGDAPTRKRKDFCGWAVNSADGQRYNAGSTYELTDPVTFFAIWTDRLITAPVVETGDAKEITEDSALLTGSVVDDGKDDELDYSFICYPAAEPDQKLSVTADSTFTAALTGLEPETAYCYYAKATNYAGEGSGAVRTFTTGKRMTFTVSFDPNGGTVQIPDKKVTRGSTYGTLPVPVLENYTFAGWYTAVSGGSMITDSTTVDITSDLTVYARWSAVTYTVSYDPNGGTGTPAAQRKEHDIPLTLDSYIPSKTYLIRYNSNGGSVSPASKSVACTFVNWNSDKSGAGTSYPSGGTYTANAGVTLYAQWTNPAAGALAVPVRSGYTFEGWFTSATGGKRISDASAVSRDITVYAHWLNDNTDPYNLGDETYSFSNFGDSDSPNGHCFGMAMTSSGYHYKLLDIGKIGGDESTPLYSFEKTATVKAPICYYQKRQGSYYQSAIVSGGSYISSDWQNILNYVRNHEYDDNGVLQVIFWKYGSGGHAVNFLRYENVDGQDRIYAYDNNFPKWESYFYQDSSGKVREAPYGTFSGALDRMELVDCRLYFKNVGQFNETHAVYMSKDDATIQGYSYSEMVGTISGENYVMYEIPEDQDSVIIIPHKDNADFIYMDTEYSFGKITDRTQGELTFTSMEIGAVATDSLFNIFEADTEFGEPDFTLPAALTQIEESAFENIRATVVYIPDTCTGIGAYAFRYSTVGQIRIPAGCVIADTAFDGCGAVQIFGTSGSPAETFCDTHDNCTFIEEQ